MVAIGQTETGIDSVEQCVSRVVGSDPCPVRVSELVIDPDERTPRRPVDEGAGLPVLGALLSER